MRAPLLTRAAGWFRNIVSTYRNPGSLTITMASLVHTYEAVVLLFTASANTTVGIAAMLAAIPAVPFLSKEHTLAAGLLVAMAMSTYSMHSRKVSHLLGVALLIPQQMFLLIACLGGIVDAWNGSYADGYIPPVDYPLAFISTDQIIRMLLAPFYTCAIFIRSYGGHGLTRDYDPDRHRGAR